MGFGANFYHRWIFEGEKQGKARQFGPLLLYQIGTLSCADGYEVPEHRQWCHELSIVLQGKGIFSAGGEACLLSEGEVQFVPKGCLHAVQTAPHCDLHYACIGFSFSEEARGHRLSSLFSFFEQADSFTLPAEDGLLIPLFCSLEELGRSEVYADELTEWNLLQILMLVHRACSREEAPPSESTCSRKPFQRAVYAAIRYIHAHIYEKISIREMAQQLGYSSTYLATRFKACTGFTPRQFITDRKMHKALDLMYLMHLTPTETAKKLAYCDVQTFNKAFRRTFSCPPTAYKTLHTDPGQSK